MGGVISAGARIQIAQRTETGHRPLPEGRKLEVLKGEEGTLARPHRIIECETADVRKG
jgi:hypothetical protein